jgi:hypothetical protein
MKLLFIILCFSTLGFAIENSQSRISQKLIIGSSHTEASFQEVKSYCQTNKTIKALRKKYHLNIQREHIGDYNVTVIKPIHSITLRNTLFVILSPMFKDIFYVEEQGLQSPPSAQERQKSLSQDKFSLDWMYYGIGLQWIALLFLSLVGLVLSLRSRRKISELIAHQQALEKEQQRMEKDIKSLGGVHG